MALRRKKPILFAGFCGLLLLLSYGLSLDADSTPLSKTSSIAAQEAITRFGDGSTAHFLETFHDVEETPAVHLFLVTKNGAPVPEDLEDVIEEGRRLREEGLSLIEAGETEAGERLLALNRTLLLQEEAYGTLLISAKDGESPLVAFHDGLPTDLIIQSDADERARAFSQGKPVTPLGVLYVSPLEYYYEFDIEGERLLVSPFDSRIFPREDLETEFELPQEPSVESSFDHPGALLQTAFPDAQIIPGVPDYDQRPWLPNSCGSTAGACLLGYWDTQGYEAFVEVAGTYDDVTALIEELCDAMSWDPATGVYYSQVPVGLRQVVEDRGYTFEISSLYRIASIDVAKQEIVEGRPFVYGSQENPWGCGHYVVTVGYDGDFIIVHDNWWSTPVDYYVNWGALRHTDDMMTTLVPEGQVSPSGQPLPSDVGGSGGGCFIRTVSRP